MRENLQFNKRVFRISLWWHLLFLSLCSALLILPKGRLVILSNSVHTPLLDDIMLFYTQIPELGLIIFVLVFGFFSGTRHFISSVTTYLICLFFILTMKHIFFPDAMRPSSFPEIMKMLHIPDKMDLHRHNSFPSGHTFSAFCGFTLLGLFSERLFLVFLFSLMASLVGFSRMYLGQHFFEDVFTSAVCGTAISLSVYLFFFTRRAKRLDLPVYKKKLKHESES